MKNKIAAAASTAKLAAAEPIITRSIFDLLGLQARWPTLPLEHKQPMNSLFWL
jgi:hypothetical protein